ncbi:MAG: hypothetical protein IAE79_05770 [Anaerolinea sp.]|nr:hypothetical protein [Anaerolinea sp.]
MNEIALIACSKNKLRTETAVPAGELYQGQLFKAQLAYARRVLQLPNKRIFVLSAAYGVAKLDYPLRPYDQTLTQMKAEERRAWGMRVAYHLGILTGQQGDLWQRVYVMGGELYRQPVEMALTGLSTEVSVPHPPGLGYARQVAWYKRQVEEHGAGQFV